MPLRDTWRTKNVPFKMPKSTASILFSWLGNHRLLPLWCIEGKIQEIQANDNGELKTAIMNILRGISPEEFQKSFNYWIDRWQSVVANSGNYYPSSRKLQYFDCVCRHPRWRCWRLLGHSILPNEQHKLLFRINRMPVGRINPDRSSRNDRERLNPLKNNQTWLFLVCLEYPDILLGINLINMIRINENSNLSIFRTKNHDIHCWILTKCSGCQAFALNILWHLHAQSRHRRDDGHDIENSNGTDRRLVA
jgi:hypothetical protein